jgi:hypothetical protein
MNGALKTSTLVPLLGLIPLGFAVVATFMRQARTVALATVRTSR